MAGPKRDANGKIATNVPDLDTILEHEDPDEGWSRDVLLQANQLIPDGADVLDLDVRCTQTFCRMKIVRELQSQVPWHEVDVSLKKLPRGEAIFMAGSEGDTSTGYLYFAAKDARLPLGDTRPEGAREDT